MNRRTLLTATGGTLCSLSLTLAGCLDSAPTLESGSASLEEVGRTESEIEACEVDHLEANEFEDDPPSIEATVSDVRRFNDTYLEATINAQWAISGVDIGAITIQPAETDDIEDAPSSSEAPFADLEWFQERLTAVLESGEPQDLEAEEINDVQEAFLEAFDITDETETVTLEHDGEGVEAEIHSEQFHGDGDSEVTYFVSEAELFRLEDPEGTLEDGDPLEC